MKVTVKLTKFRGDAASLYSPTANAFFEIRDDGSYFIYSRFNKLKNRFKFFFAKRKAKEWWQKYSNIDKKANVQQIIAFCKKYPMFDWKSWVGESYGENGNFIIDTEYPVTTTAFIKTICKILNIEDLEYSAYAFSEYTKLLDKKVLEDKLLKSNIELGKNTVMLSNGKYLVEDNYYESGIKFVINNGTIDNYEYIYDEELLKSINTLWHGSVSFMFGNYVHKGYKFYPCGKTNAKHILIKVKLNSKNTLPKLQYVLYENVVNVSENNDYAFFVIPIDLKNVYDEEDI